MDGRSFGSAPRVLLVIVIAAVAALAGYLATVTVRGSGDPTTPQVRVPRALSDATASAPASRSPTSAPVPSAAGVRRALAAAVASPALGARVLARVVDAQTGTVLYDRSGATAAAPASTAKLATAVALLADYGPTRRFPTRIVAGATPGTVVLVGGGDPTISEARPGTPSAYSFAPRMSSLADQLGTTNRRVTRIVVDDSLFSGPAVSPDWAPGDAPSEYAAPITALMVDGGRDRAADTARSGAPNIAAGRALARALRHSGLPVTAGRAPAHATLLAQVRSAPLSVLIRQMLQESDNVIAEVLARQVAIAEHRAASFTGSARAIRTVVARVGAQIGSGMRDASGLAAADRISPAALVAVLRLVVGPRAAALREIVTALPVAGWSGTLYDRFLSGSTASALGRVRAKTGTLTGVSALAGLVHDSSGRLLVFALDADRAAATDPAETALDRIASTLAGCGCR